MKYKDFARYAFFGSGIALFSSVCFGMNWILTLIAVALLLLGVTFYFCQGIFKSGYHVAAGLISIAGAQYFLGIPLTPILLGSIGLVAIILQSIEFLFKDGFYGN